MSGVLDVAGQAGDVALQPVVHKLGQTLGGSVYTRHDGSPWRVRQCLVDLGQQMQLMAPHVVRFYKCPTAGDVVDVSVDVEPIDRLIGGLGDLYLRVFLQVTVVPFVLELSVGLGHVVHRVLNHHSPSLVCGADPDNPLGDHFSELKRCCYKFWTQVVMGTSRTLVDVCATL